MKKIIRNGLLLLIILVVRNTEASNDIIYVDRMMLGNSIKKTASNVIAPKSRQGIFSNKDKIIFYYANIGVINPTKKQYDVEYICMDNKGTPIIQGAFKMNLSDLSTYDLGEDKISVNGLITFKLDPSTDALVNGQLNPLKNNNDYYIKLYVEKKLIGVTEFLYE